MTHSDRASLKRCVIGLRLLWKLYWSAGFINIGVKLRRLTFNIFPSIFRKIIRTPFGVSALVSPYLRLVGRVLQINQFTTRMQPSREYARQNREYAVLHSAIPRHSNIMNNMVNLFTKCCLTVFRKWSTKRLLKVALLTTVIQNVVELQINSKTRLIAFSSHFSESNRKSEFPRKYV